MLDQLALVGAARVRGSDSALRQIMLLRDGATAKRRIGDSADQMAALASTGQISVAEKLHVGRALACGPDLPVGVEQEAPPSSSNSTRPSSAPRCPSPDGRTGATEVASTCC